MCVHEGLNNKAHTIFFQIQKEAIIPLTVVTNLQHLQGLVGVLSTFAAFPAKTTT
jgi:hypothetical protein